MENRVHILAVCHSQGVRHQGHKNSIKKRNAQEMGVQETRPRKHPLADIDAERHLPIVHLVARNYNHAVTRVSDIYAGKISMVVVRNCHSLITHLALNKDMELLRIFRPVIEARDHTGFTTLMQLAARGDIEYVQHMQQAGAKLDAQDSMGLTALMRVAENHDIELVMKLRKMGANLESKDRDGCTALMRAAANHDIELVGTLWRLGADLEAQDDKGCTALMRAVFNNDLELVGRLSFLGCKLALRELNQTKIVLQFIIVRQKRLYINLIEIATAIKGQNIENALPLMQAAVDEQLAFEKQILVEAGDEKLPLVFHLSEEVLDWQRKIFESLCVLAEYADHNKNIEIQSLYQRLSDLFKIWHQRVLDINSQVRVAGANVDAQDYNGYSTLMHAIKKGDKELVQNLRELGANIEAKDAIGYTPLMHAAKKRDRDFVTKLLAFGAHIEGQDKEGYTALMHAAEREDMQMVQFLIQVGKANIEAKNHEGETALILAAAEGTMHVVQGLSHMGADIDAYNIDPTLSNSI